jgi:polyisoprenoid-binding protein YceI
VKAKFVFLFAFSFAQIVFAKSPALVAPSEWLLETSKITYFVKHPMHQVEGVSTAAKGKGVCDDKGCNFLIAAPVKSFDSGNSNRDAHMWQVTKAEEYPMASVSLKLASENVTGKQKTDLQVTLAGKTNTVPAEINVSNVGGKTHVTSEFVITFAGFQMERPSLLGVSVKDEIKISLEADWLKKK